MMPDGAVLSREVRLELMLENWGRWARWGLNEDLPDWPKSCASIESRYAIPKWPGDEDAPSLPSEPLGELVEASWRVLLMPHRQALCACYVDWPWGRVRMVCQAMGRDATADIADQYRARRCRMPMQAYLDHLARGRSSIASVIDAQERRKVA